MTNAEITKKIATNKKVEALKVQFAKLGFDFTYRTDSYMKVYGLTTRGDFYVQSFNEAKSLLRALKARAKVGARGVVVRRQYSSTVFSDQWVCLY
jgi:hypothetical protein